MSYITLHTTLIRDQIGQGLGFSIAGGRGSPPYKDGCDGIFISRITEGSLAHRDGKIMVGDRVMAVSISTIVVFAVMEIKKRTEREREMRDTGRESSATVQQAVRLQQF